MGFMDEYRKALKEEEEKKRKKKAEEEPKKENTSFVEEYRSSLAEQRMQQAAEIAPVASSVAPTALPTVTTRAEEKKERKWFEKGAFEDGYQFGDVTKTLLGSVQDVSENIGAGIVGMGESVLDALAWMGNANARGQYYANGGGYNIEQDKLFEEQHKAATKATEEFIKKDLYDEEEVAKWIVSHGTVVGNTNRRIGVDTETDSVFGEKTDDLIQSGGQLLATAGLQAVGVPWFLTTGATSFGAEAENALNQGASFSEAGLSGAISAGAEILTEKLSGGIKFGGKTLDDVLTKRLASGISNKLVRTMAKLGMDMVGEGSEEVLSQVASNLGSALYKEEGLGELLLNEEALDGYLESFIGGAALGGVAGGVKAAVTNASGGDYVTELTANEQAVVEKVFKDRVAEAEEDGKKLSGTEKTEIYEGVLRDMDRGYISTETIEEVLGGDDYSEYKKVQREADEYESLAETEYGRLSARQVDRWNWLKWKNDTKSYETALSEARGNLSQRVSERVMSDRLSESYRDRARRGQAFEADLTQYDAKQREVIKRAVESGILNNSNRTHEFVEMIAKISADKGVLFDFTNNERLQESGFAVEGKQVNGFVTKDGVTLNIDSPKALQSTVGHEITHVLEGTELYDAMKQSIFDYAKSKGEYDARLASLTDLYKGMDADVEAELAADLVGDYLFDDPDFINNLSATNQNVFQKMWDEVKYLYKLATAGSKEARELERVKRAFEQAYRESGKAQTETKYSFSEQRDYRDDLIEINRNLLHTLEESYDISKGWAKQKHAELTQELDDLLVRKYGVAGRHRQSLDASQAKQEELEDAMFANTPDQISERIRNVNAELGSAMTSLNNASQNINGVHKLWQQFDNHEITYEQLLTELRKNPRYKELDDKANALREQFDSLVKELETVTGKKWKELRFETLYPPKTKYSLSDSTGKQLTAEQAEYFKDSAVRDENGSLKVMYHGTSAGGYTVFDTYGSNYGLFGAGSYFTDSKRVAEKYTGKYNPRGNNNKQVYETYLNIKKPMDMDAPANPTEWARVFPDASFPEAGTNEEFFRAMEEYFYDEMLSKWEVADEVMDAIESMGYDGITHIGGGRVNPNGERHRVYIAFHPEQIKSVANDAPTADADIRYSLSSDSQGRHLSSGQIEFFKDAKTRDADGKLMPMYHGTPNGDFTVFRDGTYFTPNKEYADGYQNPDASMLRKGKVASAPKTFEVYLNITKPFDLSDAEARRIYIEEYIKGGNAVGINPYLSDAEYSKIQTIDWTEGEDLREFLIDEGYDYDGLVLDEGGTGGYGEEVKSRGNSYVVFSPEQVKNVDNTTPTADPDIRFSLSEPVEETKDLIAMHNVHPSKLMDALRLGGLPSPSIAITKKGIAHDNYGQITLLLRKESIDPQADSRNKVYGSDAWTPTSSNARTEYEVDYDEMRAFEKRLAELGKKTAGGAFVSDSLVRRLGIEDVTDYDAAGIAERLAGYDEVRAAYLAEIGKTIEPEYKAKVYSKFGNKALQTYIDRVGVQHLASVIAESHLGETAAIRAEEETVRQIIRDAYAEERAYALNKRPELKEQRINKYMENNVSAFTIEDFVKAAWQFYEEGGAVTTEVDRMATSDKLRKEVSTKEVEAWLLPQVEAFLGEPGIYNGKDLYTPRGNRRSFAETHYAYTAENIVKAMQQASDRGETWGGANANTIIATATPSYSSVEEMHADKGRLKVEDKEVYDKILSDIEDALTSIERDIISTTTHRSDNMYDEEQIIGGIIAEAATGTRTAAAVQRAFSKEGYKITAEQAKRILHLYNQAATVPTGYFEAKPQRVVGFDEVAAVVIPYDADAKLKQELLNRGLSIAEYDPNVDGDRQRVVNQFEDLAFSLSNVGEAPVRRNSYDIFGSDVALEAPVTQENAPVTQDITQESAPVTQEPAMFPDDLGPVEDDADRFASLTDEDAPPEMEAPMNIEDAHPEDEPAQVADPFEDRVWEDAKTYPSIMEEIPSVKPFYVEFAKKMLDDCAASQRGELLYNDELYYSTNGEQGFTGIKRHTSDDIAEILDGWGISWDALERGLQKIANGEAKTAIPKKLEFKINECLLHGYKDFQTGQWVEPNTAYIEALRQHEELQHLDEERTSFYEHADDYAPVAENAEVKPLAPATPDTMDAPIYESKEPGQVKGQTTAFPPPQPNPRVATVLTEEQAIAKKKSGIGSKLVAALVDKGMVFENLSQKTGNHELQAKWNYALPSNTEARAQYLMEHGDGSVKSLKDIRKRVERTGKTEAFFEYLYHVHNIDRMTLEDRFENTPNKPVYGETVTADVSRQKVAEYEKANPEFKALAEDVYAYNGYLRQLLVDNGVISQETADLWQEMYPHYVPVRRVDAEGQNISVPLDTRKTGVNAPIKKAIGGSSNITPLFNTMAQRTEQTYRAIARNAFGTELMRTLGTTVTPQEKMSVDETVDTLVQQDDKLLKPGTANSNPTFTVFENGERVEFEITEDMFDALRPANEILAHRFANSQKAVVRGVGKALDWRRDLLTTLNPVFALYRNPIKDIQDVVINSQHAAKTYANVPNAIYQMATGGRYAEEYHKNGGKSNTYFDSKTNKFKPEDNVFKKVVGLPIRAIETAGEFIEEIPRLAEYIASRKSGRSVERSMLDAARVTTNFAAGGDFTKFLNSHGFTFLNASVQGASQHVRNFREAKQEGLKGYVKVMAKYAVAGLPTILLNGLLWDDDEEYEELSDYVKQNYYVVAKTQEGKFVRIPKGRTAAVMGELFQQMENLVTGDDVADFNTFYKLFMDNIAPSNPMDNNIIAPVKQTLTNTAWYGDDIVPSGLQDVPAEEQYDESTSSIAKWLGENTGTSPYKWNYLIDQYSGGAGDVFLPMLTPEAESGDDSFGGKLLAPWKKELTTDSVLNNKNPGDFYDLRDELEKQANSVHATEEDTMRSMYMDAVSWDMSDLYKQKREIQNSDMTDSEKYESVREVQEQINALAKSGMEGYNDVSITGLYSEVGDRRFNKDAESGKWYEIQKTNADGSANKYYQKEQEVTKALGISYEQYWNNREEYNYAYDKPGQYALSKAVGGYRSYLSYKEELSKFEADKDENGESIPYSKKNKVVDYINGLDIDYGEKIILFRSVYKSKEDKAAYNRDIVDYLNSRDDISYEDMETILKYLEFEVDSNGNISW